MNTMKRVLYIHNGADLYGGGRFLLRLVSNLERRVYEPLVIIPCAGPLGDALRSLNVKVTVMKSLSVISRRVFYSWKLLPFIVWIPVSAVVLALFMLRNKIDIVHTNTGSIPSAGLAVRVARRRHIWHIHDSFHEFKKLWWVYSRYVRWSSDRVLCVSRSVQSQFGENQEKTLVVYNGLPYDGLDTATDREVTAFRVKYGLKSDKLVGVLGRVKFQRKGQDVFVKAVALLKDKVNNVKFIIVGSPFPGNENHIRDLRLLIRDLGVEDMVVLTGEVTDTGVVYRALEILVLPSCYPEPFATVILEAMANGIPVIGTNLGGTVEQIEDGVSGILIEPNNPHLLAEKIHLLLDDRALYESIRKAAVMRFHASFNFTRMYDEIEQAYREVDPSQQSKPHARH